MKKSESVENDYVYDIITDLPTFISLRAARIHSTYINEVFILKRIIITVNYIMDSLIPRFYITRSGCGVEEFNSIPHSSHDTARNMSSLFIYLYNQTLISLCTGCYDSAIISVRSLFEWLLRAISGITDLSILTKNNKDKNKAICFDGLMTLMNASNINKKSNKQKYLDAELSSLKKNQDNNFVHFLETLLNARITFGIDNIPNKLSPTILKYFNISIQKINKKESNALFFLYELLSNYTHKDVSQLIKLHPGGGTEFLNKKEFKEVYNILILVADIQMCLLLMIIDIDVFHLDAKTRRRWRLEVLKIFDTPKLWPKKTLTCTKQLVKSQLWNSKNAKKLFD